MVKNNSIYDIKKSEVQVASIDRKIIEKQKCRNKAYLYNNIYLSKMNLNEMLEASNAVAIGIKGGPVPSVKSKKSKRYVDKVLQLGRNKKMNIVKNMQQDLSARIVRENVRTTNPIEAKKMYKIVMSDL